MDNLVDVCAEFDHGVLVGILAAALVLEFPGGLIVRVHLHEAVLEEKRLITLGEIHDLGDAEFLEQPVSFGHGLGAVDLRHFLDNNAGSFDSSS